MERRLPLVEHELQKLDEDDPSYEGNRQPPSTTLRGTLSSTFS